MAAVVHEHGADILRPRAYQLEMLEDSMQRNIIVAPLLKRVFFLCPKVALAEQQHRVVSKQLPAYPTRLLVGKDGCDFWSTQSIWDEVLLNIRIVVCTHDVLCNALSHAFVKMAEIALLVFDEAHYCKDRHAANRIMRDFYDSARLEGREVPHVLGLSASPVFNDDVQGLQYVT
ncbi:MAG: hypothetical protein LQ340_000751 [Diploschistes diacapsis]|nr:MAG: hypothetical protein LQ340_000751 [Diploschistes diacapsis]